MDGNDVKTIVDSYYDAIGNLYVLADRLKKFGFRDEHIIAASACEVMKESLLGEVL